MNDQEKQGSIEFSLIDIFRAFKSYIPFFYILIPLGFIVSFIISIYLTPMYSSDILVSDNNDSNETSTSAIGGLASLAGIQLPQANNKSLSTLAILNSKTFLKAFIKEYDLKPKIFKDLWLEKTNSWSGEEPSDLGAVGELKKLIEIKKVEGGLVRIIVSTYDPEFSLFIANKIVFFINDYMRKSAIEESENLIKFLEKEAVKSSLSDVKLRIFALIQENIAEKSLANVRQEFIYKVIDKAYLSDYPSYPNKLQIRLSGVILGFLLAALLSVFVYFIKNKN